MKTLAAFLTWLLTPTYADYTSNVILFYIQVIFTGVTYALLYIGITGIYTYYMDE